MEFSQDLATLQGLLTSIQSSLVDYTTIRYVDGNEDKIARISEELRHWLSRKKYVRKGIVNRKHEDKIRKIVLFFVFNTNLSNKSLLDNKVANLIGIIPQFSKCLLTFVVFNLGLCEFYAEIITSFPVEISLELLENCSRYIQKADPYLALTQTSSIARAIYFKIYHSRYENIENVDSKSIKLLDKFIDILKNYITPVTEEIIKWPTIKMYQYMGEAIYEILNLLKTCLTTFNQENIALPYYQFYKIALKNSPQTTIIDSPKSLSKSIETLKECNKNLMSISEANVVAVTLDVFLSWTECELKGLQLQQTVGAVAYQTVELLKEFDDPGDLPMMLTSIAIKPKSELDLIQTADEQKLLENVVVKNDSQKLWFKAMLKYGVLNSENIFQVFQSLIHLSDVEDYLYLLNYNFGIKSEFDLKGLLMQNLSQIPENESIEIVSQYFSTGLHNKYETDNFDSQLREFFNKLKCGNDIEIPFNEISGLVLQNPTKFITNLIDESEKNLSHASNIINIFKFIKPICNIQSNANSENTILFDNTIKKLNDFKLEPNSETCIIQLIAELIKHELLSVKILEQLQKILHNSIENDDLNRATFICNLLKVIPVSIIPQNIYVAFLLQLNSFMNKIRWNFFSYSADKVSLTSELISLINHYKNNIITDDIIDGELKTAIDGLDKKIDSYHLIKDPIDFISFVSDGFDKNSGRHEQVCRLLKLLPSCVPLEWDLVAKSLIADKDPMIVLQLFIDVMLILSEMSKKSADNHNSLSYCFQQFCVITKEVIYPLIIRDNNLQISFIKNICRLIKHLPSELHNTVEISLVNLFNFEVLKTLKNDEEFVYSLVSISHLDICKIIISKMT